MMKSFFLLALAALTAAAPQKKHVDIQAHRGGLGLRPESTLYAFAYSIEIGADVLEMDTLFTKDGIVHRPPSSPPLPANIPAQPVVWHDHRISALKCRDTTPGANFSSELIVNLTLAQLKTLDCGSLPNAGHPQQLARPGATIPTLQEVLEFVKCTGEKSIRLNIETKLDPLAPAETWPVAKYSELIPLLKKAGFADRSYIQSFDWRTLRAIKRAYPRTRIVALLDDTTVVPEDRGVGGWPWLGGINLDKQFKGDWVAAAASIGASVLSPVHGYGGATVNSKGYVAFTTKEVVRRAKKLGMEVVPWTVDDESSIRKVIEDGVQGVISNYPERVDFVARDLGVSAGTKGRVVPQRCLKNAALKL